MVGVGRSIPVGRLTVDRLRDAVRIVLGNPAYRERAGRLQSSIEAADGLNRAADSHRGGVRHGLAEPCRPKSVGTPVLVHIAFMTYADLLGLFDTESCPVE